MYDVFIICGQSNAVGYGRPIDEKIDAEIVERSFQWNSMTQTLCMATCPLKIHGEERYAAVSFGYHFAKMYTEKFQKPIILIPIARGGTGFAEGAWLAPPFKSGRLTNLAVQESNKCLSEFNAELKGFLWHQGEQDIRDNTDGEKYRLYLQCLIKHLREKIIGGKNAPFLIGAPRRAWGRSSDVHSVLANVENCIQNCKYISSDGLSVNLPDSMHFDAVGQRELGRRYFESYSELLTDKD